MKMNLLILVVFLGFSCNLDLNKNSNETDSLSSVSSREPVILTDDSLILSEKENEVEEVKVSKLSSKEIEISPCNLYKGPFLDTILEIGDLKLLQLKIEITYTGEYDTIKMISEGNYIELTSKEKVTGRVNYFELCKDQSSVAKNYEDSLGINYYVYKSSLERDITEIENMMFVIFRSEGGSGLITEWEKLGEDKIQLKNMSNTLFNDDNYSGSWIDQIHKNGKNEYIIIGKTMGGDEGYTEGGIWIGLWNNGGEFSIIKRFDYNLGGFLIDDIDYIFNQKIMEIKLTSEVDYLKGILPREEVLIRIN